jgi:hypothetical protein
MQYSVKYRREPALSGIPHPTVKIVRAAWLFALFLPSFFKEG